MRLSGGQRQRLALATAVVGRPEVVFLDEPSAGMDPQSRHAVWDLVRELRSEGVAVVLTTHLMDEAEGLADVVHALDPGRVIASGDVPTLLSDGATGDAPRVRFTARAGLPVGSLATRLSGDGPENSWSAVEDEPGEYVVAGPVAPAALTVLTAWLAEQDALATRLTVGRRTLEDVFLDLTGRHLR